MRQHGVVTILIAVFCVLIFQTTVFAQPRMPAPPSPAERAEQLKKELNLTDAQTAKMKAIFQDQEKGMQKLFESADGDPMAMRETFMKAEREVEKKITALLNDEQRKKFAELQKQRRRRFDERPRRDE
jgi:Spy/CpxP family protein refolding chaperone